MKRNHVFPHLITDFSKFSSLIIPAIIVCSLLLMNSCDSSKGKYKFKAESMHWLQFRGPQASGIAPEDADPPVHFSADTNLLWKAQVPAGWSSPCIVNDKIFLTGFDEEDSLLTVFAINRENGELIWKDSIVPIECYPMHSINSYANPTIASDGDRIFAEFMNYGMICYDLEGNKLWEYPHKVLAHFYGGAGSPVMADSLVIIRIGVENKYSLIALNCMNGDSTWLYRPSDDEAYLSSNSTPVILDSMLYLQASDAVIALNMNDQALAWSIPVSGTAVSTPVIENEILYVNTYSQLGEDKVIGENIPFAELLGKIDENKNGKVEQHEFPADMPMFTRPEITDLDRSSLYFKDDRGFGYMDTNEDGSIDKTEWDELWDYLEEYFMLEHGMMAISLDGSGDRPFEDYMWKVNEDSPETPCPLLVGEDVFFIKNGGIATIIQRDSGNVVVHERLGAPGACVSSPLLAGNRIYTCAFNGTVTVISAEDYSVLAQNKLKEKIGASPVAVNDVLYLRTNKHLYAFR